MEQRKNDYGKQRPPRKPHLASGSPFLFLCHLCCLLHHHCCDAGSLCASRFCIDLDVLGVICIDSHLFHALELRRRTLQHVTFSRAARNACAAPPCSSPAAASAGLCLPILTCVTLVLSNEIITFASVTGLLYKRRMMKVNLFIINGL